MGSNHVRCSTFKKGALCATERSDSFYPSGDITVIEGTVMRIAQGLACTAVRMRVGERTALMARWPCSNRT